MISARRLVVLLLTVLLAASTAGAVAFNHSVGTPTPAPVPLHRLLPASAEGAACPLTRAQEQTAIDAFDELLPVILHPRCFNCHGGVEPGKADGGHLGGVVRLDPNAADPRTPCQECHGGLPKWDTPVDRMFFTDKDGRDLCMLFKATEASGAEFVRHIENDKGGVMFTVTAFKGDRGLNALGEVMVEEQTGVPFAPEPPPGTHAEFTAKAQAWADAMGPAWRVPGDCGCKVRGDAYVGTVRMVNHWELPGGTLVSDSSWARVRFEVDSTFDTTNDRAATYWKSVSGSIRWKMNMQGRCTMSASGRLPIGLGADLNPMAVMQEQPGPDGTIIFQANIGPWPDAYVPKTTFKCLDDGAIPPRPWLLGGVMLWWNHQMAGMKSTDGTTFKGSLVERDGTRETKWVWDFHEDSLAARPAASRRQPSRRRARQTRVRGAQAAAKDPEGAADPRQRRAIHG
jgi:hypothetical protein